MAVCDDQQEDRDFGQQCVLAWAQARGFAVEVAQFPTGEAFLFQYEEDRAWDILLLDVEMAQVSGVELAQRIRQEDQALQIVFLTGYSDYIAQGYDVSALHYLLKPVSREKLFAVLDRAAQRLESAQRTLVLELPGELVPGGPAGDRVRGGAAELRHRPHGERGLHREKAPERHRAGAGQPLPPGGALLSN